MAVVVPYTGRSRPISPGRSGFLRNIDESRKSQAFPSLYKKEIEASEQGHAYWLPVQEAVLPHLSRELKAGQAFTAYVRYLGMTAASPERQYVMIDFDSASARPTPKTGCFTSELLGVTLGAPLTPVLQQLSAKYGAPSRMSRGQQNLHVFVVDPAAQTLRIVGDAAAGYRNRVFSVQVIGPPTDKVTIYKSLRLGSPPDDIERVLGKAEEQVDSGEGTMRLELANSSCSVELKDGVLASVLITEDPNYFSE